LAAEGALTKNDGLAKEGGGGGVSRERRQNMNRVVGARVFGVQRHKGGKEEHSTVSREGGGVGFGLTKNQVTAPEEQGKSHCLA